MSHIDALEATLPDSLQFMRLLWAVAHGLDRTSKMMSRRVGVTGPQRLVLRVVGLSPGISAGDLADLLHVHPSTLTGVLQRLVDQGLLSRIRHRSDRRRAVLHLTPKGRRVNAAARITVEAAVSRVLVNTSDAERAACRHVLGLVADELERQIEVAPPSKHKRRPSTASTAPLP
jgi:MarR family transcriptional regulator, organic hydroperoxide resistance regulator